MKVVHKASNRLNYGSESASLSISSFIGVLWSHLSFYSLIYLWRTLFNTSGPKILDKTSSVSRRIFSYTRNRWEYLHDKLAKTWLVCMRRSRRALLFTASLYYILHLIKIWPYQIWIAYPPKKDTYRSKVVSHSGGSKRHSGQSGVSSETCTRKAARNIEN